MNENREHAFLDLATGFILGNLDELEERRFLEHVEAGCSTCEEMLANADAVRLGLAHATPPAQPSAQLKQRVLEAVAAAGPPARALPKPARTNTAQRWAMAAVLILAVGLGWYGWTQRQRGDRLQNDLAALQQRLEETQRFSDAEIAQRDLQLELVRDPNAGCYEFAPQPDAPAGLGGKVLFNPATRRAVIALDNATLPANRDYELWRIEDGVPVSLGVLPRDAEGAVVLHVADAGNPAAFAVSEELAGGSSGGTPRTVVLVAAVGG